jgi:hypothetical protein
MDSLFFPALKSRAPKPQPKKSIWPYLLACFYGGINEEILTHLFLLSALIWLFARVCPSSDYLTESRFWITNIIVAAVFGIGHLGLTRVTLGLTPVTVLRALVLNGVPALAFGWLYWQYGLEAAMLSHFCADVIVLLGAYFSGENAPKICAI